ncbi:hypothetical protein C9374_011837 [Naegleria lovaniensis]|uniref:Uncharacterized protein n=1 Tax=Naegleria lovaniensis TaxID=51637 RepID=A0AA88GEJ6_NAELO|nr:uncharacterized protein C9374_011837 [Naegleria lovaniensis]KAG2373748.1 hypothetical protein C9374_011837 [Naegleria lovaniensis]
MKRNNHNKPATPTSKTEQPKAVPSPNTTTSSDDKPRKQLSSSISSLRFMNRNKPQTPASVLQAAVSRKSNFTSSTNIANSSSNTSLTFKSTTSRVVIPSSHKNEYSNTPSSEHPSNEAVHTQHLNPITRDHLSEQWSYINEGKLDQVIQQSLSFSGNNQEQIVESLGSSNNIEQDCDSIYAMSFYGIDSSSSSTTMLYTENDHTMNNNSESLASSGRLRFGTFKQQQKQEEEEEDEKTNPLKRKKDNITLPIGWQQQQQSFTKSSSKGFNKKTKHSHKPQRKKP